jgi:MFS family permease
MFGFGWFTTSPLTSGCVADFFGNMRMGTIIGLTISFHTVGMAIGAFAGGFTYDLTGSYFWFFMAQACLEFIAGALAFAIKKSR